jgi:plastocyanin
MITKVENIDRSPSRKRFATYIKGMTVEDMIHELKKYPPKAKVHTYTEDGAYNLVCRVMQEGWHGKVVVF